METPKMTGQRVTQETRTADQHKNTENSAQSTQRTEKRNPSLLEPIIETCTSLMPKSIPPGTIQRFQNDRNQQEIDLFESSSERALYDHLGDLYSIITATESLERAYARNALTREEYLKECNSLLSQFRVAERVALTKKMTSETFMQVYQMDCPLAADRLLKIGVPEQMLAPSSDKTHQVAITVAETAEHFITTMDGKFLLLRTYLLQRSFNFQRTCPLTLHLFQL